MNKKLINRLQRSVNFLTILALFIVPFNALAISSANYEIDPSGTDAVHHRGTSTNFQLEGSIEPITGSSSTSTLSVFSGSAFTDDLYCGDGIKNLSEQCDGADFGGATCSSLGQGSGSLACNANCTYNTNNCQVSPGGGSGGGGGGAIADEPSLDDSIAEKGYTYKGQLLFFGKRGLVTTKVYINGSTDDVVYDGYHWEKLMTLKIGENEIEIRGANASGYSSTGEYSLIRRIIGDVNYDMSVNDYDLSLLSNYWEKNKKEADFNEDLMVDDYDLSLMVVYWTD